MRPQADRISITIHASQLTSAMETHSVGSQTNAASQTIINGGQRLSAFLRRTGVDATPGEYTNDLTRKNHPFAMSAAINTATGGGALSTSGLSSCAECPAASPALSDASIERQTWSAGGRATVPFKFLSLLDCW